MLSGGNIAGTGSVMLSNALPSIESFFQQLAANTWGKNVGVLKALRNGIPVDAIHFRGSNPSHLY